MALLAAVVVTLCLSASCGAAEPVSSPAAGGAPQQQPAPRPEQQPELTPGEAAKIPPFPPRNVAVTPGQKAATVTWEPSALENVVAYRIYRKVGKSKFSKVGETAASRFVDKSPKPGAVYSVTAVNVYGAESPLASTAKPVIK